MLSYKYEARDPVSGKKITGEIQADSEKSVAKSVKDQGYAVISIKSSSEKSALSKLIKPRVKTKDKVLFSRQLSTLINAGLPLVQSLRSVLNQTSNEKLKVVITDVITRVEGGVAFSEALQKHPDVFNQVFISLIAAGETSGTLDTSLERLADQQEKDAELVSKVRGALIYPILVLLVMGAVVGFMIIAVLPQVRELYAGLPGANLPFVTVALLAVSDFFVNYWWVVLILVSFVAFVTTRWARTLGGKTYIDLAKMRVPLLGPLYRKLYMARFARTSATLVSSGVPLLQTLEITGKAIDNVHIERSLRDASEKVKGGKALSSALEGDTNFLDLVPQMIKIGEDSGSIEQMLDRLATFYEKEVDNTVKSISTIIEPVLMIILGIVALVIVGAILLPIYGLVGQGVLG
jgi:type IV pilus assembly protein PilC